MKRRDRLGLFFLASLLAVVGAFMLAVEPNIGPTATPGSQPTSPGSASSQTYREGVVGHPSSPTPLTAVTQIDRDLVALLFRGLLRNGPNATLLPDLAQSWSVSSDGRTYVFNLRPDAVWTDGQPVTAADVVFTVDLAQDPDYAGPLGSTWSGITATAVSPSTVKFVLTTPLGGFMRQLTMGILPQHLLSSVAVGDLAGSDYSANPVGDGPFRIDQIDGSHALLQRVEKSYPAGAAPTASGSSGFSSSPVIPSVAPTASAGPSGQLSAGNVESIDLIFFDDAASARTAFSKGQLDGVSGLSPGLATAASSTARSNLVRYPWTSLYSIVLNQRSAHPEFANTSARRAFLAAVDRKSILTSVLAGRGSVADVPLPAWSQSFDPNAVQATAFSLSDAAADLTEAGWMRSSSGWTTPTSQTAYAIKLLCPDKASNPTAYAIAAGVVAGWSALGVSATLDPVPTATYVQRLTSGSFDAALVNYQLGLDPDVSALLSSSQAAPTGSNLGAVSDKTLDTLLATVRTTSDPTARATAISALEKYVSGNVLMLPLFFQDFEFVVATRVSGIQTDEIADPSSRFWDVLDWRLASDG